MNLGACKILKVCKDIDLILYFIILIQATKGCLTYVGT